MANSSAPSLAALEAADDPTGEVARHRYVSPTTSSPLALSPDNKLLWVVNPDDDTVSVIRTDSPSHLTKIKVGKEPQSVALDPANRFAYVANAASSNVSVIKIENADPQHFSAELQSHLLTGAEPWNVVVSPDGRRIFVSNSSQDTVTVISAGPLWPRSRPVFPWTPPVRAIRPVMACPTNRSRSPTSCRAS